MVRLSRQASGNLSGIPSCHSRFAKRKCHQVPLPFPGNRCPDSPGISRFTGRLTPTLSIATQASVPIACPAPAELQSRQFFKNRLNKINHLRSRPADPALIPCSNRRRKETTMPTVTIPGPSTRPAAPQARAQTLSPDPRWLRNCAFLPNEPSQLIQTKRTLPFLPIPNAPRSIAFSNRPTGPSTRPADRL